MKKTILPYMSVYQSSPRQFKMIITKQVIEAIRKSNLNEGDGPERGEPVRFLKQDYSKGGIPCWVEANEEEIFAKVSHCLRMKSTKGKTRKSSNINNNQNISAHKKSQSWTAGGESSSVNRKGEEKEKTNWNKEIKAFVASIPKLDVRATRSSSWPNSMVVSTEGSSGSSAQPNPSSSSSVGDIASSDDEIPLSNRNDWDYALEEVESTQGLLGAWSPGSRPPSPSVFD